MRCGMRLGLPREKSDLKFAPDFSQRKAAPTYHESPKEIISARQTSLVMQATSPSVEI
jgi:hypothetical protein